MPRIRLFALAVLLAAPTLRADIEAVSPSQGTIGTRITVEGAGFGTQKPRVWLNRAGEKKRFRLKVISFGDTLITAEIRTGVEGLFELHVKPRDAAPVTAPMLFQITAPEVLLVEQAAVTKGGILDIHVASLGTGRVRVHVGGRRARILSRDDVTGHLVVRVRSRRGCHAVRVKNRIGAASWGSGVAVLDAEGQLGPPSFRYTVQGTKVSPSDVKITTSEGGTNGAFQLEAGGRIKNTCRNLVINLPWDPEAPLPQSWSGRDLIGFVLSSWCCFGPKPTPGKGCGSVIFVNPLDPTLPWRIELLAIDGTRIAGAFSGTLVGYPTPIEVERGTFVVDLSP